MTAPHRSTRKHGWRLALVASGIVLLVGGPMHPNADASGSLREELATMTADDRWVPGHSLVLASTVLLAVGLWSATRQASWPANVQRRLRFAAAAVTAYVVEATFHLAAAVDSAELANGELPPVAFTHIALSIVLYPLTGAAIAALGIAMVQTAAGARKAVGAVAVVAGTLHATSVPFTLLLPETDNTPLFAGAAVLLALWSIGTGLVGARRPAALPERQPSLVA